VKGGQTKSRKIKEEVSLYYSNDTMDSAVIILDIKLFFVSFLWVTRLSCRVRKVINVMFKLMK